MTERRSLWRRTTLSLALVAVALVCWLIERPDGAWVLDVSSGLIVLGLAGIWVSYFAEREARNEIVTRFSILGTMSSANIVDLYYDERPDDTAEPEALIRYKEAVGHELKTSQGSVGLLAIAARGFLHEGDGYACSDLHELLVRYSRRADRGLDSRGEPLVRIALLDPMCEQAVSRGFREDSRYQRHEDYGRTRLWSDVQQSWETVVSWRERERLPVCARAYRVFPACFLLFVNDVVYVEPYHFGKARTRASGRVPVLRVAKGGAYYGELEGHFEHVWRTAGCCAITQTSLDALNPHDERFWDSVRHIHPNLEDIAYEVAPAAGHDPRRVAAAPSSRPARRRRTDGTAEGSARQTDE